MKLLDQIRFVLVGTTHPGNIGASARAMKTMGLTNLHLVSPKIYPSAEATTRASGADDVLARAVVHDSLESAITGCQHVFGREHSGLSNDELDLCHTLVNIPANPEYSSLNLAAAVQVMAYELRMSFNPTIERGRIGEEREAINAEDLVHLYDHFERSLTTIGFLDPSNPRYLMRRIRRLFNRADLDRNEVQILHGILRAAETKARSSK